jgi:DUF1009 family protein
VPEIPQTLGLIAGKGAYPRLLAESAKRQGVAHVFAVAFRKETDPVIERHADRVAWIHLGQFGRMLDALRQSGVKHAVMAGQITPTHLFRLRLDAKAVELLRRLTVRNAETIFGAVGAELQALGIDLLPASSFMEAHMPPAGVLSRRGPTEGERRDIEMGLRAARMTSGLDIGQTVVVKNGTILAVEAFEGTDAAIRRAAKLGGPGLVVVKVPKRGHDMRFDIPVVGVETMKLLRKVKAAALAVQAGRAILLEREKVVAAADAMGLCLIAVNVSAESASPS